MMQGRAAAAHVRAVLFRLIVISFALLCRMIEGRAGLAFEPRGRLRDERGYGFAEGAWPFGAVAGIWTIVAVGRWWLARKAAEPIA